MAYQFTPPPTPQVDIDRCLTVERNVTPGEMPLYLECMNGVTLAKRLESGDGWEIRDGCILMGVFLRCSGKQIDDEGNTVIEKKTRRAGYGI